MGIIRPLFLGFILTLLFWGCGYQNAFAPDLGATTSATPPPASTQSYAYIGDTTNNLVWICSVSTTNGSLSNCSSNGVPGWTPDKITLTKINGTSYAYVADNNNFQVWRCIVSATDGSLNSCEQTGDNGLPSGWAPTDIQIFAKGGTSYAYIAAGTTVYPGATLYYCAISTSDGTLSGCNTTGDAFGLVAQTTSFQTFNGTTYAYVLDLAVTHSGNFGWVGGLWQCSVNSDGTLSGCNKILTVADFDVGDEMESILPNYSNFQLIEMSGAFYGYTTTGIGFANFAQFDSSGNFVSSSMQDTGQDLSWQPTGVNVSSVGGTYYGYVNDNSTPDIWVCSINTSNGTFTSCTASGLSALGFGFGNSLSVFIP